MIRCDHKHPCKICGSTKWCLFSDDGLYCSCKKISEGAVTNLGQLGFLHKLKEREDLTGYTTQPKPQVNWKQLQRDYSLQLSTYRKYPTLAGIDNPNTYQEFFMGWNGKGWTFPVWGEHLQIAGMQVRFPDGVKCSVTGTQIGVFVPKTIMAHDGIIGVAEGLSDAMAACELGIKTVGKWNCSTPHETLLTLIVGKFKPTKGILIFADNDGPGKKGAVELRGMLKTYLPNLPTKTIVPPLGVKDLREYKRLGLTASGLRDIIYKKGKA